MRNIIVLILTCFCWDAMSNIPYFYQDYPYYSNISLVDKSKFEMKTYEFAGEEFKEILNKKIATGKKAGNKYREGDEKTPEGIYFTQRYTSKNELQKDYGSMAKIYGAGAWTLNYPNIVDKKIYKKTGTGIWIHGTDDPKRIDEQYSSKGCVVLTNEDFNEFSLKNEKPHPVIISDKTDQLTSQEVESVLHFLNRWKTDWEMKDDNYFSNYDLKYNNISYKKEMFSKRKDIVVTFSNVNILKHKDYYQVNFVQNYKDSHVSDVGFKTLFISKKDHKFQILDEQWSDLKIIDKTAKKE